MDNIGGILEAYYIASDYVNSCAVMKEKIILSLAASKDWINFNPTKGKVEILVTPGNENGLTPYSVSGTIYCPRFGLSRYNELTTFNMRKFLIKYVTGNGDVLIAGDKETPLTIKSENVNPAAANGFSGTKITISGTMKHSELVLVE